MSRKNVVSFNLFDDSAATTDMSADCVSRVVEVKNCDKASLHLKWGAGPVGEFQVQAKTADRDTFFNINPSITWSISNTDSEATIILTELPFTHVRLNYIRTSGSGTLSGYMNAKTVGA